ncbi:hypothetical protein GCM10022222_38730 [Amycolatopsis ultiminotia]|uniref:Diadenosine tetraphosphate (Ap4A) hydrolase n=1 Tax=Amycolatopsis ultiminotia TaxID=543629 RepID=A0ABP6WK75_9PSEU
MSTQATTGPAPSIDVTGCLICSLDEAPADARVFSDPLWAAEVVPGYEVPGWFFLRARRHAELISGLDDDELHTLAPRAQDLTEAVREATGAEAVYFMSFGESYRHYHALITARGADVLPTSRGGFIVGALADGKDRDAALALVPTVRRAYARLAAAREQRTKTAASA